MSYPGTPFRKFKGTNEGMIVKLNLCRKDGREAKRHKFNIYSNNGNLTHSNSNSPRLPRSVFHDEFESL